MSVRTQEASSETMSQPDTVHITRSSNDDRPSARVSSPLTATPSDSSVLPSADEQRGAVMVRSHHLRWRVADIAVGAALSVACGVIFWGFNFAYASVSPLIGAVLPGLASILHGFWYFSGTLAVLIIRKPGAAVYVNVVGSLVEGLLGSQYAMTFVLVSAAIQGLFAELPFMVTRYRHFTLLLSVCSGALTALEYGVYLLLFRFQGVSFFSPRGVIHMISELISGVVIAGVMSWFLYVAIAKTGALDRFESGRAIRGSIDA